MKVQGMTRPLKIFIVENDTDSRNMLAMLLAGSGHEVQTASNMTDALRAIPASRCEVLISDIGLPDGNGWDLMALLQQKAWRPAYAIAMSGYGMGRDIERSKAAGYRQHLIKPMDIEQLERLLTDAAAEADGAANSR